MGAAIQPTIGDKIQFHWLRSARFDLGFIFIIALFALSVGSTVAFKPDVFGYVLFVNLWLLGYHHVIATYTRICFSAKSMREYRFLIFQLPIMVLVGTFALAYSAGAWVIATTYLYWQWFHYTRQSYGISRYYLGRARQSTETWKDINTYALYLLPLAGIAYRSYQNPEQFLGLPVVTLPVPYELVMLLIAASGVAIAMQLVQWGRQYRAGNLHGPYVLYALSHYAIFGTGYLLIENINHGWLVLNIWHNTQYIAFVWLFNNNRFKGGVDPEEKLISTISQDGKVFAYLGACLLVTVLFYMIVDGILDQVTLAESALPMTLIFYMTINFHHYIVDGIIWRRPKAAKGGAKA